LLSLFKVVYNLQITMKYSPTWINDNFPLNKLECQYFDICKDYIPGDCQYNFPCPIRKIFREHIEDYVTRDYLHEGIIGIINEKNK